MLYSTCTVGTTGVVIFIRSVGLSQGHAFGVILDFTGSIAGSFISFVMPAAIFLKLNSKEHKFYWPCVVMLVFGVFVMITVPIVSIVSAAYPAVSG